jgi:hypothetical protein
VNLSQLPTSPLSNLSSLSSDSSSHGASEASEWLGSCAEEGSLYQQLKKGNESSSSTAAAAAVTVFADSNPGLVDNLRRDLYVAKSQTKSQSQSQRQRQVYLGGVGSKSTQPFSLLWFGYQTLVLRDFIGKFISMKFVEKLVPRYGLVVAYDEQGKMIASLHDPTGTEIAFISHAERHPMTGDLWLGSHSEAYIGILPKEYVNW